MGDGETSHISQLREANNIAVFHHYIWRYFPTQLFWFAIYEKGGAIFMHRQFYISKHTLPLSYQTLVIFATH